jgi:CDP-diacylglycerol pyrophosphatase
LRTTVFAVLLTVLASGGALCAMPAHSVNRDALRQIVQEQCLVHWRERHQPAPCERVAAGWAVLADRKGGAHFLLIATKTIAGIESAELLNSDTPNYFLAAWQARDRVAAVVGREVPRGAIGLAVNPPHARTQDQLHIHIECLRPDVFRLLNDASDRIRNTWSTLKVGGAHYEALRIMGEDLDGANPFELLAKHALAANHAVGDYTLVLAGMQFRTGPGFILLASTGPAGELLLDSTCAIASG